MLGTRSFRLSPFPWRKETWGPNFRMVGIPEREGPGLEAGLCLLPEHRRARQQLPGHPCPDCTRAQTVQTLEPVEPLASGQTACMSIRG